MSTPAKANVKTFFSKDSVNKKFEELLGKNSKGFVSSLLQVVSGNNYLKNATPDSIYGAAMMAAVLNLPINNNLGCAYIVPYKGKAQFQMGYRGYIQLAHRSGEYKKINSLVVYETQFVSWDPLNEIIILDFTKKAGKKVSGYVSMFEMNNGFIKYEYWTKEEVTEHAKKYSKSFNSGPWKDHFDAMAKKTVLKSILNKYGLLSIEMNKAIQFDQAVVNNSENMDFDYPDNAVEDQEAEVIEQTEEEKAEKVEGKKELMRSKASDKKETSKSKEAKVDKNGQGQIDMP